MARAFVKIRSVGVLLLLLAAVLMILSVGVRGVHLELEQLTSAHASVNDTAETTVHPTLPACW
jgi:hypothetical protein